MKSLEPAPAPAPRSRNFRCRPPTTRRSMILKLPSTRLGKSCSPGACAAQHPRRLERQLRIQHSPSLKITPGEAVHIRHGGDFLGECPAKSIEARFGQRHPGAIACRDLLDQSRMPGGDGIEHVSNVYAGDRACRPRSEPSSARAKATTGRCNRSLILRRPSRRLPDASSRRTSKAQGLSPDSAKRTVAARSVASACIRCSISRRSSLRRVSSAARARARPRHRRADRRSHAHIGKASRRH